MKTRRAFLYLFYFLLLDKGIEKADIITPRLVAVQASTSDQITGRIIALAAADVSPFPGNRQLQLVAEAVLQGLEVNGAFGQVIVGDGHAQNGTIVGQVTDKDGGVQCKGVLR